MKHKKKPAATTRQKRERHPPSPERLEELAQKEREFMERFKREHPEEYEKKYGNASINTLMDRLDKETIPAAREGLKRELERRVEEKIRVANRMLRRTLQEPARSVFEEAKKLHSKGVATSDFMKNESLFQKTRRLLCDAQLSINTVFIDLLPGSRRLRQLEPPGPEASEEMVEKYTKELVDETMLADHLRKSIELSGILFPFAPEPDWDATPTDMGRTWIAQCLKALGITEGQGRRSNTPQRIEDVPLGYFWDTPQDEGEK